MMMELVGGGGKQCGARYQGKLVEMYTIARLPCGEMIKKKA